MNWSKKELIDTLKNNRALRINPKDLERFNSLPDDDKESVKRKHKYNARPEWYDGIYFDSQAEKHRYCELKLLKRAGKIKNFKVHVKYKISDTKFYEVDFEVEYPDGHIEVEDVKGYETDEFLLKAELFRKKYPNIPLVILKCNPKNKGER